MPSTTTEPRLTEQFDEALAYAADAAPQPDPQGR